MVPGSANSPCVPIARSKGGQAGIAGNRISLPPALPRPRLECLLFLGALDDFTPRLPRSPAIAAGARRASDWQGPQAAVRVPARIGSFTDLINNAARVGRPDLQRSWRCLKVAAFNRLKGEGVSALVVSEPIGSSLHLRQPAADALLSGAAPGTNQALRLSLHRARGNVSRNSATVIRSCGRSVVAPIGSGAADLSLVSSCVVA